jgi:predicted ATPase
MSFRFQINNYRILQAIDFSPDGVCLIVGANGCGKTTLLSAIELLRNAFERGFGFALDLVGGTPWFTHINSPPNTPTTFAIETASLRWELNPTIYSNGFVYPIAEKMTQGNQTLFEVESGASQFHYGNNKFATDQRQSALKRIYDFISPSREFDGLIQPLTHYRHHYDYNCHFLVRMGSPISSDTELKFGGQNAFSVLRNWQSSKPLRERYEFVIDVLKEAFPNFFDDLDFESAGMNIVIRIYYPNHSDPLPVHLMSHGFLTTMLHLMAVCSIPDGGIVGIDEPENGLHPYAIHVLMEACRQRAAEHSLTVLLTTHSPFMLNEFKEEPQRVYVMESHSDVQIVSLDKLKDPIWIKQFKLGNLYGKEFARMGD